MTEEKKISKKRKSKSMRREQQFDYTLLLVTIFLLAFGMIMVFSTGSVSSESSSDVLVQGIAAVLGIVGILVLIFLPINWIKNIYLIGYVLSNVLFFILLFYGGTKSHGATRWLPIKITGSLTLSVQPAEIAKLALILFLAVMISKIGDGMNRFRSNLLLLGLTMPLCLEILLITSDLSSTIIVFGIAFLMLFVANKKYWGFILSAVGVLIAAAGIVAYTVLKYANSSDDKSYRFERILAWLDPSKYAGESGMQTIQSLYAIGSGGIFGKGLGESMQKWGTLPEAHNDMIFAIVCEELGFIGGLAIIILFILLIWRMMVIAQNTTDLFGAMLVVGVMSHFAIQVLINIAVVTNTIPNTGVTLPFISAGGTSVLFSLVEIGLVLRISRGIYMKE